MSATRGGGLGRRWLACGAWCAALAVVAGAFGAHGLADRLDARGLELWETAARYLMYGGLALGLLGLSEKDGSRDRWLDVAGTLLLAGAVVFSATVALLALDGPRWLGAVTPIGGTLLILGFLIFAWAAVRH